MALVDEPISLSGKLAAYVQPGLTVCFLIVILLINLPACASGYLSGATEGIEKAAKAFRDVTVEAGIRHVHHKPVLDHQLDNIMPWLTTVGAAAAAGDFDNDGWIDLYVTDSKKGTPNHLYRNNHDGTFSDVARRAGVADLNGEDGTSMDCAWADYDNDGFVDLYVVRWGRDVMFRNRGDGTFEDVTRRLFTTTDGSSGTDWANGNGVIFFDFNLDGLLDIYVGNYFREVDLWHLKSTRIMHNDFERARNGGLNYLYRRNKGGGFTEIAGSMGLEDPGWTLAVGSADLNNDGWPDLYCADDFGPDQLFLNNGKGRLGNVTKKAIGFDTKKGMNVDFGDFNNDGWFDVYVTNITTAEYLQEGNMLWYNNGPDPDGTLTLTDIALETGCYDGGWGWGAKFFDYDNDGDLDIVATNGFISAGKGDYWYDLASWTVTGEDAADARNWPAIGDRSFSGYETLRLFRNDDLFAFTERAAELGLDSPRDGRGVVIFDYDNDGDLDLFIANQGQRPHLYQNTGLFHKNHWLTLDLKTSPQTGVNRDGIGTRVTAVTSSGMQIRERDGGNGYAGQSDPRIHFGLGKDDRVQLLEVRWPDGGLQYVENLRADRMVEVRQDPTRYAARVAVAVSKPKPLKNRQAESDRRPPQPSKEEIDRILAQIETHVREAPNAYAPGSLYRRRCASYGRHDQAIRFFQKLIRERPEHVNALMQLGCAYVDKIPTCGGIAAVVSKGMLATKSLAQFDRVIEMQPELWEAYLCRGMNHLHWPRALRHNARAVADFKKCLELQQRHGTLEPYYLRVHIGLGDAYTKAQDYAQARQAWKRGLRDFPDSAALKTRLSISSDTDLLAYVEAQRNLEHPIETDLSFLDAPR